MIANDKAPAGDAASIVARLDTVANERHLRQADPALAALAMAVRTYQAGRFRKTYADLMESSDTQAATLFFLNELYGVQDFQDRDAQFRRVAPGLVRLFPAEVVRTVADVAEVHALSEQFDTRMAQAMHGDPPLDVQRYRHAWRSVGDPAGRARQIELVDRVGHALVRYTRHPNLRRALRMLRLPARAAGLAALQSFLERGFDTFGTLADPEHFLSTINSRETALAAELFGNDAPPAKATVQP